MEILVGGDLVPTAANFDLFDKANTEELLGSELYSIWSSADIRLFNLEAPLTDELEPIDKNGPCLAAPESSMKGIASLNPSLVALANNHILDQGADGLERTQHLLEKHNIPFIGAGINLREAAKPYIFTEDKMKIGIYNCAEHEFSIATENTPGANPFDPLESLDHIVDLKSKCDYVIVLYHGGKEHYRYPSPNLQRICRKMSDKGADLVVCQHSHCIGCFEEYNGATIVYGQGNFVFSKYDNEFWNTSLLIKVSVKRNMVVNYIPIMKSNNSIKLADEKSASTILEAFIKRSGEMLQEGFIKQNYIQFAMSYFSNYIRNIAGFGKWKTIIDNRLLKGYISRHKYKNKQLLAIQNYIECEAHRELFLTYIKETNVYR